MPAERRGARREPPRGPSAGGRPGGEGVGAGRAGDMDVPGGDDAIDGSSGAGVAADLLASLLDPDALRRRFLLAEALGPAAPLRRGAGRRGRGPRRPWTL